MDKSDEISERKLVSVFLRAASIKHAYKREAYGIFEYLGDLGGIFSIVSLLAYYLTQKIIRRLYYASIIGNTYTIQHYGKDESQFYQTKTFKDHLTTESSSKSEDIDTDSSSSDSEVPKKFLGQNMPSQLSKSQRPNRD